MGKEECLGPVELKDDGCKKEYVEDNTNTEVGSEKAFVSSSSSSLLFS